MHKGVCIGGPMAGLTIHTRSEIGFVATDRPGSAAWLYYTRADGAFELDVTPDPSSLDDDGTRALDLDRALAAAAKGLDVIAVPGDGLADVDEPVQAVDEQLAPAQDSVAGEDPREGQD